MLPPLLLHLPTPFLILLASNYAVKVIPSVHIHCIGKHEHKISAVLKDPALSSYLFCLAKISAQRKLCGKRHPKYPKSNMAAPPKKCKRILLPYCSADSLPYKMASEHEIENFSAEAIIKIHPNFLALLGNSMCFFQDNSLLSDNKVYLKFNAALLETMVSFSQENAAGSFKGYLLKGLG